MVLGLLYGDGDFGQTIDISARAGDDSDCNPATAGGILGTMLGYGKIPASWRQGLAAVEPMDFKYTTISLAEAYALSLRHALKMIVRNGGSSDGETVRIKIEPPQAVPFEAGFEGHRPIVRRRLDIRLNGLAAETEFSFDGIGFAVNGEAVKSSESAPDIELKVELAIDGEPAVRLSLPTADRTRKPTLFWRYRLKPGQHRVRIKLSDAPSAAEVRLSDVVIYAPSISSRQKAS